jgi:hypothetical protein
MASAQGGCSHHHTAGDDHRYMTAPDDLPDLARADEIALRCHRSLAVH